MYDPQNATATNVCLFLSSFCMCPEDFTTVPLSGQSVFMGS